MDLCGSMRPSKDIMNGQIQMIIMTESSALALILAYMAENRITTPLEAEFQGMVIVESNHIEKNNPTIMEDPISES